MEFRTTRTRFATLLLLWVGILSILAGLGIGAYSWLGLKPRIAALPDQLNQNLTALDQATASIPDARSLVGASAIGFQSSGALVHALPETLSSLRGTLLEVAQLLQATSNTAEQTKKGITGLVAPKPQLTRDQMKLQRTSEQVTLLAGMVDRMRAAAMGVSGSVAGISSEVSRFQTQMGSIDGLLGSARSRIRAMQQAIDTAALPTHAALLGTAIGGLFILLGVVSMALAVINQQVARSLELSSSIRESVPLLRRVA